MRFTVVIIRKFLTALQKERAGDGILEMGFKHRLYRARLLSLPLFGYLALDCSLSPPRLQTEWEKNGISQRLVL